MNDRTRRDPTSNQRPGNDPGEARAHRSDFELWYRTTHPTLVRALLFQCNGDVDVASDAVDEAMVRAYERWSRVHTMESPEAWTYRVAVNLVRRYHRRRGGERAALARTQPVPEWVAAEEPSSVWWAVSRLDRREREAIVLRYVVGLSEAEVAVALGVRVGTASSLLSRARRSLRVALEPAGSGNG